MVRRSCRPQTCSRPGLVAERLERDGHLHGPAAVETPGPEVPHGVPVAVDDSLVGHQGVEHAAVGGDEEEVAVAPIQERVEGHRQMVVLPGGHDVAAQLVGHDLVGVRFPAPARDVQVVVVEQDPDVGVLGRRLALPRLLLDQSVDGRDPGVDVVIEAAVDANRLGDARGPHRDVAAVVTRDDVAGRGHRQACQRSGLDRGAGLPAGGPCRRG